MKNLHDIEPEELTISSPYSSSARSVNNNGGATYSAKKWRSKSTTKETVRILACHGWLDNANSFDTLAPILISSIPNSVLVAFDFTGHGKSSHQPNEAMYNGYSRVLEVLDIADALGWEHFILMGHSMGAGVSTYVAGTCPERVLKLILLDGFIPLSGLQSQPQQLQKVYNERSKVRQRQPRVYKDMPSALARYMTNNPSLKKESAQLLLERGAKEVVLSDEELEKGYVYSHDPRLTASSILCHTISSSKPFLVRIICPVLLIVVRSSLEKWKVFNDAVVSVIPLLRQSETFHVDGNHHIHLDNPNAVAPKILQFILGNARL